jgi:hypothetical protein
MLQFQMRVSRLVYALLVLPSTAGAFTYNESINGDLSGNRLAPTALVAAVGSNTLIGTTVSGDVEYVRITLPAGTQLTSLILNSITSTDDNAFIAVQQGTTFTGVTRPGGRERSPRLHALRNRSAVRHGDARKRHPSTTWVPVPARSGSRRR